MKIGCIRQIDTVNDAAAEDCQVGERKPSNCCASEAPGTPGTGAFGNSVTKKVAPVIKRAANTETMR